MNPECRRFRPLVSAYVDGEATPEEISQLREHLKTCADCQAALEAYGQIHNQFQQLSKPVPPPELRQAVFARVRGGTSTATLRRSNTRMVSPLFRFNNVMAGIAAAIVLIVIAVVVGQVINGSKAYDVQAVTPQGNVIVIQFTQNIDRDTIQSKGSQLIQVTDQQGKPVPVDVRPVGEKTVEVVPKENIANQQVTVEINKGLTDSSGKQLPKTIETRVAIPPPATATATATSLPATATATQAAPSNTPTRSPTVQASTPTVQVSNPTVAPTVAVTNTPGVTASPTTATTPAVTPSATVTATTPSATVTVTRTATTGTPGTTASPGTTTTATTGTPGTTASPGTTPGTTVSPRTSASPGTTPTVGTTPGTTPSPGATTPAASRTPGGTTVTAAVATAVGTGITPATSPATSPTVTAAGANCAIQPQRGFGQLLSQNPGVAAQLGCPNTQEANVTIAYQAYQNGFMFYDSTTKQIYVLGNGAGGSWSQYPDTYAFPLALPTTGAGTPTATPTATPNAFGCAISPINGFGKLWRENQGVRSLLGCPVTGETSTAGAAIQRYTNGVMYFNPIDRQGRRIYILFGNGQFLNRVDEFNG